MISADDAVTLCVKLSQHKQYLERQIDRHEYLTGKFPEQSCYPKYVSAFKLTLDHFNSLFGEDE